MPTIKHCTIGPKHSWAWHHNANITHATTRVVRISLRGVYRCACGAQKDGRPNPDGPDLHGLKNAPDGMRVTGLTIKRKD